MRCWPQVVLQLFTILIFNQTFASDISRIEEILGQTLPETTEINRIYRWKCYKQYECQYPSFEEIEKVMEEFKEKSPERLETFKRIPQDFKELANELREIAKANPSAQQTVTLYEREATRLEKWPTFSYNNKLFSDKRLRLLQLDSPILMLLKEIHSALTEWDQLISEQTHPTIIESLQFSKKMNFISLNNRLKTNCFEIKDIFKDYNKFFSLKYYKDAIPYNSDLDSPLGDHMADMFQVYIGDQRPNSLSLVNEYETIINIMGESETHLKRLTIKWDKVNSWFNNQEDLEVKYKARKHKIIIEWVHKKSMFDSSRYYAPFSDVIEIIRRKYAN